MFIWFAFILFCFLQSAYPMNCALRLSKTADAENQLRLNEQQTVLLFVNKQIKERNGPPHDYHTT